MAPAQGGLLRSYLCQDRVLFAAATRSGAILGGATAEQEQALYDYGHHLGMAFQIVDDVLDYAGQEATLGKPVGGDLRQGIVTLPFFYFLQSSREAEVVVRRLEAEGKHSGSSDVFAEVAALVRASGAIESALAEARQFAEQAKADLALLPGGEYADALWELANYTVARHT